MQNCSTHGAESLAKLHAYGYMILRATNQWSNIACYVSRPDIPFLSWQLKRAHRCKKKALMASQECNDIEMTQDGNGGRCDCNACNDHKTFRPHLAACTGPYSCAPVSQEWDYMVSKVPNRTKEGEPRIVTEVMLTIAVVWMWSEVDRKTFAFHRPRPKQVSLSIKCYQVTVF